MKKTLSLFSLVFLFSIGSYAAYADVADLNLTIHKVTTFKKIDGLNTYEKLNEVSEFNASITENKEVTTYKKQKVDTSKAIYAIDKNIIHITDEINNVNTEVPVIVKKTVLGRIKSFTITGNNFEIAYMGYFQKSGLLALEALDLKRDERKSMIIGDQNCAIEYGNNVVKCEQDIHANVNQYKAVLVAALYVLELEMNFL